MTKQYVYKVVKPIFYKKNLYLRNELLVLSVDEAKKYKNKINKAKGGFVIGYDKGDIEGSWTVTTC